MAWYIGITSGAALFAAAVSLQGTALAADLKGGTVTGARPRIAVAFPKTYDRYDTARLYEGFVHWVAQCAKVDIVDTSGISLASNFSAATLLSENDLLDGMAAGKLQLMQVTTGQLPLVEEKASGVPFAVRGDSATGRYATYKAMLIVNAANGIREPKKLIGKKIAHSTPGSHSGNLVPRAHFPALGLFPDKNYSVVYSKGHERSIMGLYFGYWDGAAVASDQFERMAQKKEISLSDYRVLWESEPYPVEAWVLSKALQADVRQRISACTYSYRFPDTVRRLLGGSDSFVAIDAAKDIAALREVLMRNR